MTRASACPPEYNVLDTLSRRAHRRFVGSLIAVRLVQLSAYASQMSKISASGRGSRRRISNTKRYFEPHQEPVVPVAVVAIGGNSLIKDEDHPSVGSEIEALRETCGHIAGMLASGWDVVLTHGNGPQVGFNLLRSELAARIAPPLPLDVLGAQTQGSIGYLIQQVLGADGRCRDVAAVSDKDLASALMEQAIGADLLLISTQLERMS